MTHCFDLGEEYGQCPVCGGPSYELGTLGNRMHFRCQNCGMDWSHEVTKNPAVELGHNPQCDCPDCLRLTPGTGELEKAERWSLGLGPDD